MLKKAVMIHQCELVWNQPHYYNTARMKEEFVSQSGRVSVATPVNSVEPPLAVTNVIVAESSPPTRFGTHDNHSGEVFRRSWTCSILSLFTATPPLPQRSAPRPPATPSTSQNIQYEQLPKESLSQSVAPPVPITPVPVAAAVPATPSTPTPGKTLPTTPAPTPSLPQFDRKLLERPLPSIQPQSLENAEALEKAQRPPSVYGFIPKKMPRINVPRNDNNVQNNDTAGDDEQLDIDDLDGIGDEFNGTKQIMKVFYF